MKYIKGLASLAVLLVLVIGIPAALILVAGNPLPSAETVSRLLTTPDYGGHFLFGTFLPLVAWIAWLTFTVSVALEIPPALSGIRPRRIRGLGAQQALAGALIGTILFMFTAGSLAGAPAAQATPELKAATQVSAPHAIETHTTPEAEEKAEPASALPKHTVGAGESLWKLAEQYLGDGSRFGEIAELNYGVSQADGGALSDSHWIEPGWVLALPAGSAAAEASQSVTHVVAPGESLSSIAQQHYGEPDAYEAIFQASSSTVQPDGRQLTDPGFIAPGWELTVPSHAEAVPAEVAPSTTSAPEIQHVPPDTDEAEVPPEAGRQPATQAPAQPEPVAAEALAQPDLAAPEATVAPSPVPGATVSSSPVSESADTSADEGVDESTDAEFPTRTIGGIGSILAAGILSILGLKRISQRRQRKAGERIAVASRGEENLELQLRAVEDPMTIDDLDHALKYLAVWGQNESKSLPQMFCVRVASDEIALYLAAPAVLPEPFVPADDSNTVWTVEPRNLGSLERIPTAPYPALVTVGQDAQNANLLVDLEYVGALGIAGEEELVSNALAALAVELATSKWGEQLQVTMVGVSDELPAALSTGKVRHVDDLDALLVLLRGKANATGEAFTRLGVSGVEEARALGKDAEGWMPEIVILGQQPTEDQRAELEKLVTAIPRLGIAAVSAGRVAGDWEIRIGSKDAATLEPLGLDMVPQLITAEENQKIMRLMAAASQNPVPGPEWASTARPEDISIDDVPVASAQDRPLYAVAPDSPEEPVIEVVEQEEPVPDELEEVIRQIDTGKEDTEAAPIISVLGSVSVINPQGEAPKTPGSGSVSASAVARCTALAAFLALNPGASSEKYHEAFWPTADPNGQTASSNRNKLSNLTRNYLGQRHDGQMYFPHADAAGYKLHPEIKTDWHVFLELIGENLSRTSTPRLVAALRLVRGQPFSGVKGKLYGWADLGIRDDMIAAICDAAHELAGRSLKTGSTANARLAGAVGRIVDPANEQMWRDALLAEHAAGNSAGVEELVAKLHGYLDDFDDDYEPDEETQDLIQELRRHGHPIAS